MKGRMAQVGDDAHVRDFIQYLDTERNASEHTTYNYLIDLTQFVGLTWGADAQAPFRWADVDRFGARLVVESILQQPVGDGDEVDIRGE